MADEFNPTLDPFRLLRQFGAGAVMAVPDLVVGLPGALGHQGSADIHAGINDTVNSVAHVDDPFWRADPTAFIARQLGGAVVGLPARTLGGIAKLASQAPAALRYFGRAVEAASPITLPLNRTNIAINAGVGGTIGAGAQELGHTEQEAQQEAARSFTPLAVEGGSSAGFTPIHTEGAPSTDGFTPIHTEASRTAAPVVAPRTTAGTLLSILPYAALGGMGYAGIRAVRQMRAASAADQAASGGIVQPGLQPQQGIAPLTVGEKVTQGVVSDNTGVNRAITEGVDSGAIPAPIAADVRGRIATQLSESPKNDIISEHMRTGLNPLTGSQHKPWVEIEEEVAQLSKANPDSAVRLREGLAAASELDTRMVNLNEGRWIPGQPGVPARVTLHGKSDGELKQIVAAAMRDPEANRIMADYRNNMDHLLQDMVGMGLKTPEDVRRMAQANPNYVHTLFSEDRVERDRSKTAVLTTGATNNSPITERTHGHEAGAPLAQDPIIAGAEAARKVLALGLENDARRAFVDAIMPHVQQQAATNPTAPRLVRGVKVRDKDKTPPGWVPVHYYDNGKRKAVEVAPAIAEVLQSYPRQTVPLFSAMARLFRNTTTGPLAAVFGTVQAPVSAGMAAMATAVNRPPGTKAGLIDAGVQRLSGGRFGVRGDPTFLAQTAVGAVKDLSAEGSRAVASALRRSELKNGPMARYLGTPRLQQIMNSAQQAYDNSQLAQSRRMGSTGTGIARDPENSRTLGTQPMALTPDYAAIAQSRTNKGGIDAVRATMERFGARATPVEVTRTWRMFTTALDIVSGAATSAFLRNNQGAIGSPKGLHGVARRLAGDPAEMGASPRVQQVLSSVPYSNVTIQSLAAYVRAIKAHPVAAITGITAAAAVPQIVQLASAILADEYNLANGEKPEHVMSVVMANAAGQSSDIRVHIPGVPASNAMRIVGDLSIAPLSALANNMLINFLGVNDPRFWTPEMEAIRKRFTDFVTDRTWAGFTQGIRQAGGLVTAPPLLAYGAKALFGTDVTNALDLTGARITTPRDVGAPGYTRDRLFNDPVNHYMSDMLETVFGATGKSVLELYRTGALSARQEGSSPLAATADQYSLNFANTARIAPPMLQPDRQLPQRDAAGDVLAPKEEALTDIANGMGDLRRPGTVGAGRAVQPPLGEGRPAPNPELGKVLTTAIAINNALAPLREQRKGLQDQLVSIDSSPEWRSKPIAARVERNRQVEHIRALNRTMYAVIHDAEAALSHEYGRTIRFDGIDTQRGLDQFTSHR